LHEAGGAAGAPAYRLLRRGSIGFRAGFGAQDLGDLARLARLLVAKALHLGCQLAFAPLALLQVRGELPFAPVAFLLFGRKLPLPLLARLLLGGELPLPLLA